MSWILNKKLHSWWQS